MYRKKSVAVRPQEFIPCLPVYLPADRQEEAAAVAIEHNPLNAPNLTHGFLAEGGPVSPLHAALLTQRCWGYKTVQKLTVRFLDTTDRTLKARILSHANAWSAKSAVHFSESMDGLIRLARTPGSGYWSYIALDCTLIPAGEPTMNLDSFSMGTPESEYKRVVRHEFGHAVGFVHEHMRKALVALLDPQKCYRWFLDTYGWPKEMVDQQVLTPLDERTLMGTPVDKTSIMCYQISGEATRDGKPIVGGTDINASDLACAGRMYPKVGAGRAKAA